MSAETSEKARIGVCSERQRGRWQRSVALTLKVIIVRIVKGGHADARSRDTVAAAALGVETPSESVA
jgi:hypothetical protein